MNYQKSMSLKPEITDFLESKFKAVDDGTLGTPQGRVNQADQAST
jgi:hypothetical protein